MADWLKRLLTTLILTCFIPAFAGTPMLRIDPGMHAAPVLRVAVDTAGQHAVTGSQDGTVRVWSLADGTARRVLRIPLDGATSREVTAVAIAPVGDVVAVASAGARDSHLYLFDLQTGVITRHQALGATHVARLRYSPDGSQLAGVGHSGLTIWNSKDLRSLSHATGYRSTALSWEQDGRLLVAGSDGRIHRYDQRGNEVTAVTLESGKQPHSIDVSPDGRLIAVGFLDSPNVDVRSTGDLGYLFRPFVSTDVRPEDLANVAWAADGKSLFAGHTFLHGKDQFVVMRYYLDGKRFFYDSWTAGTGNSILDLVPLADGGLLYGSADPTIVVTDAHDKARWRHDAAIADHRDAFLGFPVSANGHDVTFSYTAGGRAPALFSVDSRTVRQGSERESGPTFGSLQEVLGSAFQSADWDSLATAPLNYAFNEADGITLANADSGFGGPVTINDHPIALDDGERANAGTLTPTLDSGIIGTSVGLRRVGRNGTLQWRKQTPSSVLQVNATPDGKLIVAHIADGTVRWYRAADGRELLALFPHADRKRWIAWTPSGYYAASAGADSLAGWQVDHGSSQAPDFYPLARFRNTYYRPDVMVRILDTHDEALALRQSGISPAPAGSPASRPPPVVEIVAPRDGSIIANQEVVLHYRLRSTDGSASARVQVLIDGRPMGKQRGLQRLTDATGEQTVTVTVPPRDVAIALVGVDDNGTGEAASIHLRWQPPAADAGSRQPSGRGRLNLLAVGVSDYLRQQLALRYPAKDASDVRATFSTDSGGTYASVQTRLLTNREATRDAILDGLQWLQQNTARGDVAAIFLAGHGVNSDTGAYYFLPTDFDPDAFKRTGLPYTEVKDTITSVQGRALLFVDTCHAGNVMGNQGDVDEIASDLASAENGVVVFAASTGKQVALENPSWKNGAFSLALVEGLSGKADYTRDGAISVSELETWLSDRVQSLTGGAQTPTSAKPFTVPNFVISRINTD